MRCCSVLLFEVSYHRYYCCTYQVLYVESLKKTLTAQLSPAIAQQRSAAPCGTVRCRALPCGAVPCCAALPFEHTAVPGIMRYPVPIGMYVCTCVLVFFRFLHLIVLSQSSFLFILHPYWRSERDNANKHTQQSTGQSALRIKQLLALSNS